MQTLVTKWQLVSDLLMSVSIINALWLPVIFIDTVRY